MNEEEMKDVQVAWTEESYPDSSLGVISRDTAAWLQPQAMLK